jgi:hypothetical protein
MDSVEMRKLQIIDNSSYREYDTGTHLIRSFFILKSTRKTVPLIIDDDNLSTKF